MGCDIHENVEYLVADAQDPWRRGPSVHLSRNYFIFSLLTGGQVRSHGGALPLVTPPPRGLPPSMSRAVYREVVFPVVDRPVSEAEVSRYDDVDELHPITLQQGEVWARQTFWVRRTPDGRVAVSNSSRRPGPDWGVFHPDWHSFTYLGLEEMRAVRQAHNSFVIPGGTVDVPARWFEDIASSYGRLGGVPFTFRVDVEELPHKIEDDARLTAFHHQAASWPEAMLSFYPLVPRRLDATPSVPGQGIAMTRIVIEDETLPPNPELDALVETMERLQERDDVLDVRFVAYFDN